MDSAPVVRPKLVTACRRGGSAAAGHRRTPLPFTSWHLVAAVSLVASASVFGVASAQEVGHKESAGRHEAHHHRNHVALFVGATEAEEEHGEKEDPRFTLGIDYERRLSRIVGIGALLDLVVEGKREFVIGVPVFLHIGRSAKFQLAPGFEHLAHRGEDQLLFRTGFMWDFWIKRITISPALMYDITEGQNFFVVGANIGTGF